MNLNQPPLTPEEHANLGRAMIDGPALRFDQATPMLCVNPTPNARGKRGILLGGLGAFGVGRMWCEESDDVYWMRFPDDLTGVCTDPTPDDFGRYMPFPETAEQAERLAATEAEYQREEDDQ